MDVPQGSHIADLLIKCATDFPRLEPYYDVMAVAVNQEYSNSDATLNEGDEVALIPPVSGGNGGPAEGTNAQVRIVHDEIKCSEIGAVIRRPPDGAVATFEGIVRDNSRSRRTLYLDYEAYEPMALKEMKKLADRALKTFAVRDVAIVHRLGRLQIGETSVLIVVASAHRSAAFEACRWLIDALKKSVPIWKKEYFEDGAVWADGEPFPPETATRASLQREQKTP